ncbi:MAG: GAF domain-containing protein [Leptolyngbyaceae bacterium]|nr:GAF domain-containing protein [Leptolyngbyaceae bacterium]
MKQENQQGVPPIPANQQELLNRITNQIRSSVELQDILDATAEEVRHFLGTDRVKIYQFQPDGHGLVVAESLDEYRLPSLLGLHFPADDIPIYAREMFLQVRQRMITDLGREQIGISPIPGISGFAVEDTENSSADNIRYRPVDPCHVEYLRSMGVQSSMVVPIVIEGMEGMERASQSVVNSSLESSLPSLQPNTHLWGLLVSHHADPYPVTAQDLSLIQSVVDQLAIAITHSILLNHFREEALQKADIAKIISLLHDENPGNFQAALDETVKLFHGAGGRLYLPKQQFISSLTPASEPDPTVYTYGTQPDQLFPDETRPIEENLLWQHFLSSVISPPPSASQNTTTGMENGETAGTPETLQALPRSWSVPWMRAVYALPQSATDQDDQQHVWAISDVYQEPLCRSLVGAFQATAIRGILILPFHLERQVIGCLTIFRDGIDQELIWAGKFNPDKRQLSPRQSFEAWRQLKEGQVTPWRAGEIRLGKAIAERFATAVKQHRLYEEVSVLNATLEEQVEARTQELRQTEAIAQQQQAIATILTQLQTTSDITTIFRTAIHEVRHIMAVDDVTVYRFDPHRDETIAEVFSSVAPPWSPTDLDMHNIWQAQCNAPDHCCRIGDVVHGSKAVNDIYAAHLTAEQIRVLEQQHIRAFMIVPIVVGQHLWGLFSLYQQDVPRQWNHIEVSFTTQIAAYLGSALQHAELFALTQQQADQVPLLLSQQQTISEIIGKIRESLDLGKIFATTTQEVRRLLNVDRVCVFKFDPNSNWNLGKVVAEDRNQDYVSAQAVTVEDHCFGERYAHQYELHRIFTVEDIYNAGLKPCYIQTLEQFQVRANLVVPLRDQNGLWGLLSIHQCSGPRQWQAWESQLAEQIATHLSVALQQAELFQQAEEAKWAADMASQAKSEFLATMSHELRTPLNAILGFSEGLQDGIFGKLTKSQEEAIATIEQSGQHLLALITDILDLAKIESGELIINPVTINFTEVCTGCLQFIQPLAQRKHIELISDLAPYDHPITLDPLRVRQLLINLLNNAVKFTPAKGQVTLKTWVHVETHTIEFHVVDTGIGIAPEDIPKIFQSFVQLDSRLNRQYEGTGLGLALVKQLVEAQQGSIKVDSVLEEGSCFRVTLPYQPVSPEAESSSSSSIPRSVSPIPPAIAQPTPEFSDSTIGAVTPTHSSFLGEADSLLHPESVITILPTAATSPVQDAANNQPDAVAQATDEPADTQAAIPKRSVDGINPGWLILLAEDNESNVETFSAYLTHHNHHVLVAHDGREAIALAQHHHPDIILMDIHMPHMDGIDAIQQIRQLPEIGTTPIIALTALAMPGDQERCIAAGANDYLAKPVKLKYLGTMIDNILAHHQQKT